MNRRIKHIVFFVSILTATHFLLLNVYEKTRQKKEITQVFKTYEKAPKSHTFLFLGTSHVKRGVDTSIVKSSFSMAYYGQNNINAYYVLKYFLEHHATNFQYICLPNDFDYYSKRAVMNMEHEFFYHDFFDYEEYGKLSNTLYESRKKEFLFDFIPYLDLRKMLKSEKKRKEKGNQDFSLTDPIIRKEIAANYLNYDHQIKNPDDIYDPLSLTYLEMTLDLLKKHKKDALFINFPLSSDLNNEIKSFGNYNHKSDSLIIKYGYEIIDISNIFNDHDDYFIDAHHLNNKGGIECSKILQETLNDF